jgi:hypothetical protein
MVRLKRIEPGWYIYESNTNEYNIRNSTSGWYLHNYNKILKAWVTPPRLCDSLREAREYVNNAVRYGV